VSPSCSIGLVQIPVQDLFYVLKRMIRQNFRDFVQDAVLDLAVELSLQIAWHNPAGDNHQMIEGAFVGVLIQLIRKVFGNGYVIATDLTPRDDVDRMHNPRNISQDRQQDVEPKVLAQAHFKKNAQGRQKHRNNDTNDIHGHRSFGID